MSLERDFARLFRAIDEVLLAGHAQRRWLRDDHPPFATEEVGDRGNSEIDVMANALRHYGGVPSAGFDLWLICRAIEALSIAWTGKKTAVPVQIALEPVVPSAPSNPSEP